MKTVTLAVSAFVLSAAYAPRLSAVEPFAATPRLYVNNMGGFGSYLAAAFRVKGLPLTLVVDRRQADFEMIGTSESKSPNWADTMFLRHGRSDDSATISIINLRTAEVVYAYAYNTGQAYNGQRSAAESCALDLKAAMGKGQIDFGNRGGALTAGDDDRPAGETTKVPPSEADAASAIPPEKLLMSVNVTSLPSDALVEVDGYAAGRTPVSAKLTAGTYKITVAKPGFQAWSQKITVEVGKAQNLGITLSEGPK